MTSLSSIPFRDRFFFATVYFVQGAMSLAGLAKLFFLKNDIGLNEVEYATLAAIVLLPFTIKPIYGMISDFFPIFGRRRKFYLLLGSLLNILSWIYLGLYADTYWAIFAAITLTSVGLAVVDVIADGMIIERSTPQTVGKLQTLCWFSVSLAALIMVLVGGYLLEIFEPRQVFLLTAFLPLLTFVQGIFINDPKVTRQAHTEKETASLHVFLGILGINAALAGGSFWAAMYFFPENSTPENFANAIILAFIVGNFCTIFLLDKFVQSFPKKIFLGAVLFLFLWRALPSIGAPFQYFIINEYGWDEKFLKWISTADTLGNLTGAVLFWKFFDTTSLRKIFFWTIIIGSFAGLNNLVFVYQPPAIMEWTPFGFPGIMSFALVTDFLMGMLFYLSFLPLFKLAARIVPKNMEATLFALVASFMNLGLLISTYGGGILSKSMNVVNENYENMDTLIITASLLGLVLIPFLIFVPKKNEEVPTH